MNIEIPRGSYNMIPEVPYFDISHWSVCERSRKVAERDPSLRETWGRFSAVNGDLGKKDIALLLPGTLGPADMTFRDQIPLLENLGLGVVLVDYSNSRFSIDMIRAQLTDFINSPILENKRISLIGFSLGTGVIFDLLFRENEIRERVNKIALLGSVFSSHDLGDLMMRNLGRIPKGVTKRGLPIFRALSTIDTDPALTPKETERVKKANRKVNRRSFAERIVSFMREREKIEKFVKKYGQIENADTILIKWQKDFANDQRNKAMSQAFSHSSTATITGAHGWTATSAGEINALLTGLFLT